MCACAAGELSGIDESDFSSQRGKRAVSRFVSAEQSFSLEGSFLSSVFLLSDHFVFHLPFVRMQRTKCQECRKTYYCVVVQGMRWCFCFVSCHKWSILDVLFPVKTIESCSSGASTSGVDIFRGGGVCICFTTFSTAVKICVGENPSVSELRRVFWDAASCVCIRQPLFDI